MSVTYSGLTNGTQYIFTILNDKGQALWDDDITSVTTGQATVELPDYFSRYDGDYRVEIYEKVSYPDPIVYGDLVIVDNLHIHRPYTDPADFAETEDDLEQAIEYEALARSIIDTYSCGFSFNKSVLEITGNGSDFLPVLNRITKVIQVWENNVLVYDAENEDEDWTNVKEYTISADRTAIIESLSGEINRYQSKPYSGRDVGSDSFTTADYPYEAPTKVFPDSNWAAFPNGWDYVVVIEHGYPVIPQDIQTAAKMLLSDLKCGASPYLNSYMKEYESDGQFKVKFNDQAFMKTGNLIVDRILSNYPKPITGMGVI